jgi:D-sedoheptulose 7-phosphate isomerase
MKEIIKEELNASARLKQDMADSLAEDIARAASILIAGLKAGKKVVAFGNGGSACDAQHLAAELVGRFGKDRRPLAALTLTADSSVLTSLGNDYGYSAVFSRQVSALIQPGDVAVAISTSGNSENVIQGVLTAKDAGARTVALLGNDGGRLKVLVDVAVVVPAKQSSRVQEGHISIIHVICKLVEEAIFGDQG